MESPLTMCLHGAIAGLIGYVIMIYGLGQSPSVATARSVVLGLSTALYMVLFGHGLPTRLNPQLGF